jgi:hypothetical protein
VGRDRNPSENAAMYLVEIEIGREQLYQSVEALAAAIRNGVIGPDSRIFHRASSSWISITLHPEYRKLATQRPSEPLPPLSRNQWTFFGTESPTRQTVDPPVAEAKATTEAQPAPARRGLRRLFSRGSRSVSDKAEQSGA